MHAKGLLPALRAPGLGIVLALCSWLHAADVLAAETTGAFAILHNFDGAGGQGPRSALVQGADGAFYGTAEFGGLYNGGVAYRLTGDGDYQVLHHFGSDGLAPVEPYAGLVLGQDGFLYGTTVGGGQFGMGTIYRLGVDGTLTVLHAFKNDGVQGIGHVAPLVQAADGNFYGSTQSGGSFDQGTVFRISPSGAFKNLHSFGTAGDGAVPEAGLMQASDGNLYGTTASGGAFGVGAVYRLSPKGKLTLIHSFSGNTTGDGNPEGCEPVAALVQGLDGQLWGTANCGSFGYGVVFRMSLKGAYKAVHSFQPSEGLGGSTLHALTRLADGNFVGTVHGGGQHGGGNVYRVSTKGKVTALHAFPEFPGDGIGAFSPLLCTAEVCRGTTEAGGSQELGTVYAIQP